MKSKTGELSLRNETGDQGEIDLYGELEAYSHLSPEEQEAYSNKMSQADKTDQAAPPEPFFDRINEVSAPDIECPASLPPAAERADPFPGPVAEPASQAEIEPVPARMGTGDLLSAFASFTDAGLPANSAESRTVECSSCGCESDLRDMFCVACGAFLEEPSALELAVEPAHAAPLAGDVCADCREVLASGEIFCPSCGAVAT